LEQMAKKNGKLTAPQPQPVTHRAPVRAGAVAAAISQLNSGQIVWEAAVLLTLTTGPTLT
jgi:hypothetical protein